MVFFELRRRSIAHPRSMPPVASPYSPPRPALLCASLRPPDRLLRTIFRARRALLVRYLSRPPGSPFRARAIFVSSGGSVAPLVDALV